MVTHLALELSFQGKKLRGFTCKLTRSAHGFLPETSWIIAAQVVLPYLVSGLGMVAAGIVMDIVQVWGKRAEKCACRCVYVCVRVCGRKRLYKCTIIRLTLTYHSYSGFSPYPFLNSISK